METKDKYAFTFTNILLVLTKSDARNKRKTNEKGKKMSERGDRPRKRLLD